MRWNLLVGTTLLLAAGCGSRNPLGTLQMPDQLTLFSIDGRDPFERSDAEAEEKFHDYPVLGKIEITDPAQRQQLMAALNDAYARRPKEGMKCYHPRHGVRATENGKTVEYVIYFECSRFYEFVDGSQRRYESINYDVQPTFDKPLTDAGIPIAPR